MFLALLAFGAAYPRRRCEVSPRPARTPRLSSSAPRPTASTKAASETITGTATVADGKIKVAVEIDMDSLYTDTDKLTQHLKSPDFFGVKA